MKKHNKITLMAVTLTMFVSSCFTGCASLENTAPHFYPEWDKKYIYCGNVRCKTTGEEEEQLVEKVTYDGMTYNVVKTLDVKYEENDIYLCLHVEQTENAEDDKTCLMRYSIEENESELIYFSAEGETLQDIDKVTLSVIVLSHSVNGTGGNFQIDHAGNYLKEIDLRAHKFASAGDYLLFYQNGQIYYRTWEDENAIPMFPVSFTSAKIESYQIEARCIEEAGQNGLLVALYDYESNQRGLWYYDFHTQKTTQILDETKWFAMHDNYIVSGTRIRKEYESLLCIGRYVINTYIHEDCRWSSEYEILATNSTISMLVIDENGVSLKKLYDFKGKNAERSFTEFFVGIDGKLYFEAKEVRQENVAAHVGGEVVELDFCFNPKTKQLKNAGSNAMFNERTSLEGRMKTYGVSCGDYVYHVDRQRYDNNEWYLYWDDSYAQVFYRYHIPSGKMERLQFMPLEKDREKYTQFSFQFSELLFDEYYALYSLEGQRFLIK